MASSRGPRRAIRARTPTFRAAFRTSSLAAVLADGAASPTTAGPPGLER